MEQDKLVTAHTNSNSLRKKVELLTDKTKGNVGIFLFSKTKVDKSFPNSQFKIDGFSNPYRVDHNEKGGRITLLFREYLPVKDLLTDKGNETCYVEVILRKTKWLIKYSYNPTKNNISSHMQSLSWNIDLHTSKFKNVLVIRRALCGFVQL